MRSDGAILFSPNGDTLNVRGGTINGSIVGQNAGDTINFTPGAGNTFTYGAAYGFSHVSFVNVNSGLVVLDGANQAGSIAVNGGVLRVGDASHPGATLTGSFIVEKVFNVIGPGAMPSLSAILAPSSGFARPEKTMSFLS